MIEDLFTPVVPAAPGFAVLPGFARAQEAALLAAIETIAAAAPFRRMATPGGHVMSVATTSCGTAGWITDRRGYRYAAADPLTGTLWPAMPARLAALADAAAQTAGFAGFQPDSCLINRYEAGAKMALHQDRDEVDLAAPIVSVSLGIPAVFLWGGTSRSGKPQKIRLESGDVVVFGGPARLNFHGIAKVAAGRHILFGPHRINLTFRQALW